MIEKFRKKPIVIESEQFTSFEDDLGKVIAIARAIAIARSLEKALALAMARAIPQPKDQHFQRLVPKGKMVDKT